MRDDYEQLRLLTLNLFLTKGIGSRSLIKHLPNRLSYQSWLKHNKYVNDFSLPPTAKKFFENLDPGRLLTNKGNIVKLSNYDVKFLTYWEDEFPELLKQTYNYPAILFYKGNSNLLNKEIFGIVGTRNITDYGKKYSYDFSKDLSNEYVIISGMAMGVDKEAHLAALDNSKETIAVIPGGPESARPTAHRNIYERILNNNGLIISEDFPGTTIMPGMFASRNRIIAGLSKGVLIVEADIGSGSLITADLANEFGREVFAVPGRIDGKFSNGTNKIIKEGRAKLVQNVADILDEFGKSVKMSGLRNENLSSIERLIVDSLNSKNNLSIEELVEGSNEDFYKVLNTCIELELSGLIKKDFSGRYYL